MADIVYPPTFENIENVVAEQQYRLLGWGDDNPILVDYITANLICSYVKNNAKRQDALNKILQNKNKFILMVNILYKHYRG